MSNTEFRKYTSLPVLLNLLYTKKITLSDPSKWEDKNDFYYLEMFKRIKKYKTVLVSCFSDSIETYHHWKIYSGNQSGICIVFHKDIFLPMLSVPHVLHKDVEYEKVTEPIVINEASIEKLPFYKRFPYRDESEYRILYFSSDEKLSTFDIEIDLKCIKTVIINPWLDESISTNMINFINSYIGNHRFSIYQSTLLENEKWKKRADDFEENIRTYSQTRLQTKKDKI